MGAGAPEANNAVLVERTIWRSRQAKESQTLLLPGNNQPYQARAARHQARAYCAIVSYVNAL